MLVILLIIITQCFFVFKYFGTYVGGLLSLFVLLNLMLGFFVPKGNSQAGSSEVEEQLKAAQNQLIKQDKLASVGVLTAGIAHEIKNPLNFINNFSDMTVELVDELKDEVEKVQNLETSQKESIIGIAEDIGTNCRKINEHGKRAESIIKNMLIQTRASDVGKEPVDLNKLLDEYMNLAYHGLRAQNNKFNAKLEKNLDPNLPKVTASSQSMGRVFLNIINNGLYAANEKSEQYTAKLLNTIFMPTITIASTQNDDYVIIKIKDNGNGMPDSIRAKIFEPFFTTKPAGQGTGLGLPICYDIVTKEHGGKLEVVSKEGEFSEFIIMLPKDKA
ncbi:MAG: sensor histidine kinase [Candidatus Berkiella sp.]